MPLAYLTLEELDDALTGDLLERGTPEQRQASIERATADANGYLRAGGYATPVVSVPDELKGRIADVARYRLAVILRLLPEPASTSSLWIDYQAAIQWFRDVAAGIIPLDIPLADPTSGAPGTASVFTSISRRWDRA